MTLQELTRMLTFPTLVIIAIALLLRTNMTYPEIVVTTGMFVLTSMLFGIQSTLMDILKELKKVSDCSPKIKDWK